MVEKDAAQKAASTGIRIALERDVAGPPWNYRGDVSGHGTTLAIEASIATDGVVTVAAKDAAPDDAKPALEKVRLLLRTVHRQSAADDTDPPRRLLRWRDR